MPQFAFAFAGIIMSQQNVIFKGFQAEPAKIVFASCAFYQGYEHNVIFDLTYTHNVSSRSSAKLVKLLPNTLLDMMVVYERLLKNEGHNCDEMMALTVEDLANISLSLSDWLGEF